MLPVLAEISDKLPSVAETAAISCAIAIAVLGLTVFASRWCALLLPVAAYAMTLLALGDLSDPNFGKMAIEELGGDWVIGQALAANIPFVLAALFHTHRQRRMLQPEGLPGCSQGWSESASGTPGRIVSHTLDPGRNRGL